MSCFFYTRYQQQCLLSCLSINQSIKLTCFEKISHYSAPKIYSTQKSVGARMTFLIAGTYQLPTLILCSHMFLYSIINCRRLPISGGKGFSGYLANHFLCFASDGDTIFNPVLANSSSHPSCTQAESEWAYLCTLIIIQRPSHIRTELYLDLKHKVCGCVYR